MGGIYWVCKGHDVSDLRYCVKTLTGHAEWVRAVEPSEDGRLLISASNDQVSELSTLLTADCQSMGLHIRGDKGRIARARACRRVCDICTCVCICCDTRTGRIASGWRQGQDGWRICSDRIKRQIDSDLGHTIWAVCSRPCECTAGAV